ncbi:MAG: AI-2E family transporter, partial [Chthonomonadales bacterium]
MVAPTSPPEDAPDATDAQPEISHNSISVSPDTITRVSHAVFTLWIKIGFTLIAFRFFGLVWPVLILIISSLMLVATLNPLLRKLQKYIRRTLAISAILFVTIVATGGLIVLMVPPLMNQANNLVANTPGYLSKMEVAARGVGIKLKLRGTILDISQRAKTVGPEDLDTLATIISGISAVLTVAVLTTYLLIDGSRVGTSMIGMLPRHQRLPMRQMVGEIGLQVGDYMRGQIITSGQAGIFSYVYLLILGIPEPLPLAVLMAVADVIPMAGPLIATIPAVLLALTLGMSKAIYVLVGYLIYHLIESHILVPRIYGKTMKLS